jgi:hypothetical protein
MIVAIILGLLLLACGADASAAPPDISPEQAVAAALNNLSRVADGYLLQHPDYTATFSPTGLEFRPRRGGPTWCWCLTAVGSQDSSSAVAIFESPPLRDDRPLGVRYARGSITERYRLHADCIEQEFVIADPLALSGGDLEIYGTIQCVGDFEAADRGWIWSTPEGIVSLSQVCVYDAAGRELGASMSATASGTRIRVDGAELASAVYPVTIDPEIGINDFRISDMGPDGDIDFDAHNVAVAYNSVHDEFLVVWEGDDDVGGLVEGEFEIFGQRVSAVTGLPLGSDDFRISQMGPDGDHRFDAVTPAVAFNPERSEYLVVWSGEDDLGSLSLGEFEIYGQRLDATGLEVGTNDLRISDMGPDGYRVYDAQHPVVVYAAQEDEYVVAWEGDDDTGSLVEGESEIFVQRIDAATGAEVGVNDARISDMGPDGDPRFDANAPAIAYSSTLNEYLVAWEGDDDTGYLIDGESEIFVQQLDAATGSEIGINDHRISAMGPDGSEFYDARFPAAAYNPDRNEYLLVWEGDDSESGLVEAETEIFGQRLDAVSGIQVGTDDFRISQMGPDGDPRFDAVAPAVAYSHDDRQYLVVWEGDTQTELLVDDEFEIFSRRIDAATGSPLGSFDIRLSDMGADGDVNYDARGPALAFSGTSGEYFVSWSGDDGSEGANDESFEAFGQRVDSATGEEVGTNDVLLSDMGSTGDLDFDARVPAVAYNPVDDEYLVVWQGDDDGGSLSDGEFEIFAQRIDARGGYEVGANDIRLSDMGPDGDMSYDAMNPAVAYNSANHEYLVVWEGEDDTGLLVAGEFEIFGQRLEASTGLETGTNDFRISDMGPDGSTLYDASRPDIAYNPANNEYLVVWVGDDDTYPLVDGEMEIRGQRIAGASGSPVGTNDFVISDMGPSGDANYDAGIPAVAYNGTNHEFLVVWSGEDGAEGGRALGEFEIFGQRINAATGGGVGENDFPISDMGPSGDPIYDASSPDVTYNGGNNEYLVVWSGDDDSGTLVDDEFEIFGQRLAAATGTQLGTNDFRISSAGPDGDVLYDAREPAVVYNAADHHYLVVWQADNDLPGLAEGESEIYGQLLDASTGYETGDNDFRLSDMGADGDPYSDAFAPALAFDSAGHRYLVVWEGDDASGLLGYDEFEIYGQLYVVASVDVPEAHVVDRTPWLRVWPQPVRDDSIIEWQAEPARRVTLHLYSVQGRLLIFRSAAWADGMQRLYWRDLAPGRRLPSGTYFLELQSESGRSLRRSVVLVR